jgi:hypothetical protein
MTTTTQQDLDLAAELTTAVVLQAMSVRGLTRDQAVALVAEHTGTNVDFVEACLDRVALMVAS